MYDGPGRGLLMRIQWGTYLNQIPEKHFLYVVQNGLQNIPTCLGHDQTWSVRVNLPFLFV